MQRSILFVKQSKEEYNSAVENTPDAGGLAGFFLLVRRGVWRL